MKLSLNCSKSRLVGLLLFVNEIGRLKNFSEMIVLNTSNIVVIKTVKEVDNFRYLTYNCRNT